MKQESFAFRRKRFNNRGELINPLCAGQIGPVEIIGGVYTAKAVTPGGEEVYFAMESIDNHDKGKWIQYKNTATLLVNGGGWDFSIGSLAELGFRIHDEIRLKKFLATRALPSFWTVDQQKFDQLRDKLREGNVVVGSPKDLELSAIPHAANGINVDAQTHMVYVSKAPVSGRISFTSHSKGFGRYVEEYGDLLMCVGVTIDTFVESRGIFRNPLSVVEGGYRSISMMTHCFTCMTVRDHWPAVKIFRVRPLKKMGELFLNSLPKEQVTVNRIRGDVYDRGFETEQDVRVPVEVLARLHCA